MDNAQIAVNYRSLYSEHYVIVCGVRLRKFNVKGSSTKLKQ